jgi:hypothetical protein
MFDSKNATLNSFGALLILLGLLGLAIPYFTTSSTKDVMQLGDMKVQTTESTSHAIPQELAGGALILGLVLLGIGLVRRG